MDDLVDSLSLKGYDAHAMWALDPRAVYDRVHAVVRASVDVALDDLFQLPIAQRAERRVLGAVRPSLLGFSGADIAEALDQRRLDRLVWSRGWAIVDRQHTRRSALDRAQANTLFVAIECGERRP